MKHERQSAEPSRQLLRIGERTGAALSLALHRRVLVQLADRAPVEVLAVDVAVVEESRERAQRPRQRLRLRTARTTAPAQVRLWLGTGDRSGFCLEAGFGKSQSSEDILQNIERLFASQNLRKPAPNLLRKESARVAVLFLPAQTPPRIGRRAGPGRPAAATPPRRTTRRGSRGSQ